ncbi:hypothetical protein GA0115247_127217, partial [Streptomyces sp. PalvLS-984]
MSRRVSLPGADELFRTTGGMGLQASSPADRRRKATGEAQVPPPGGTNDSPAAEPAGQGGTRDPPADRRRPRPGRSTPRRSPTAARPTGA